MKLIRILLVLAGSSAAALAQTNALEIRKLSLENCLIVAIEHNLDVQIKRYNPEIARYNLRAIYGSYDLGLSLSREHDYSQSAGGVDPQGRSFGGTETDANRASTALC